MQIEKFWILRDVDGQDIILRDNLLHSQLIRIASRVVRARESLNMSQTELALLADVSIVEVERVEAAQSVQIASLLSVLSELGIQCELI